MFLGDLRPFWYLLPPPANTSFKKPALANPVFSLNAKPQAKSQRREARGEGVMLYWMRVKAVDHPATSWERAPRERVPHASEHPCQRQQSSGCCWWPLAATHRLASLRSDPTAFPDTFGLAESRMNPAWGHDSSSNCGTETGASPSPQEPALRCRFSSGSDSRGHRDTS